MDITSLEYFKIIAENGSLTKAAQQLHITQPAMSAMLKKLEEELGVELFDRSPNRIHLNKAGEVALVHVNTILRNVEQLKADVLSAARQSQTLSIAFCDQGVRWFSVPRFSVAHPEIRVNDDLYEGDDTVELLRERVYDLMVTPQKIQDTRIQSLPFLSDQVYLSIPETVAVEPVGNLDALRDLVLTDGEPLSTDVSQNSDLRALDIQAEVLHYQLKAANAARIPTIAAFGSATITGNDMEDFRQMMQGGAESGTGEAVAALNSSKYYWTHPITVGLQISIPIFSGLTNSYKAREVRNRLVQLDLQRDYARRQTAVAVQSAINNLLTARETMLAQAKTMEQADKAYRISDTRFRAGAGTILELNTAQLNRTQAHLNYSQAIYDYLSAQADYDQIVGKEPERNEKVKP